MEMRGSERIEAPRERVYEALLHEPDVLRLAIPGCESIEKISDTEFEAVVTTKVGPVKATFRGSIVVSELDPPQGYVITGQGKGGVAGFATVKARVQLEPDGTATLLNYAVDAQVGGKLAQLGGRLIHSAAKKFAADFFGNFGRALSPGSSD